MPASGHGWNAVVLPEGVGTAGEQVFERLVPAYGFTCRAMYG